MIISDLGHLAWHHKPAFVIKQKTIELLVSPSEGGQFMINTAIDNSRTSYLLFRLYQLRIVASFLALMLLASPIYAQAGRALEAFINVKLITAHEKKNASMTIPPEIVFLSMGPINSESSSLRFVIRLDEIYNSIVIEEI